MYDARLLWIFTVLSIVICVAFVAACFMVVG